MLTSSVSPVGGITSDWTSVGQEEREPQGGRHRRWRKMEGNERKMEGWDRRRGEIYSYIQQLGDNY